MNYRAMRKLHALKKIRASTRQRCIFALRRFAPTIRQPTRQQRTLGEGLAESAACICSTAESRAEVPSTARFTERRSRTAPPVRTRKTR